MHWMQILTVFHALHQSRCRNNHSNQLASISVSACCVYSVCNYMLGTTSLATFLFCWFEATKVWLACKFSDWPEDRLRPCVLHAVCSLLWNCVQCQFPKFACNFPRLWGCMKFTTYLSAWPRYGKKHLPPLPTLTSKKFNWMWPYSFSSLELWSWGRGGN